MNPLGWLPRRRAAQARLRQQFFLEAADALFAEVADGITASINGHAPAGEPTACGCWPQYLTCRCAVRAENGV